MRILVADDHILFRHLIQTVLTRMEIGSQIMESQSRSHTQELLDEDGFTHVISNTKYLPLATQAVIIATSSSSSLKEAQALGAQYYLQKPIQIKDLLKCLTKNP